MSARGVGVLADGVGDCLLRNGQYSRLVGRCRTTLAAMADNHSAAASLSCLSTRPWRFIEIIEISKMEASTDRPHLRLSSLLFGTLTTGSLIFGAPPPAIPPPRTRHNYVPGGLHDRPPYVCNLYLRLSTDRLESPAILQQSSCSFKVRDMLSCRCENRQADRHYDPAASRATLSTFRSSLLLHVKTRPLRAESVGLA